MKRIFFLFLLCSLPVLSQLAWGDSVALPQDYEIVSENNLYRLIVLTREGSFFQKNQILRLKYAESGLYKNNGKKELLWKIDWFASEVNLSNDGHHLIRFGGWPGLKEKREGSIYKRWPDLSQRAVAFYKDGQLLKEYLIDDLVTKPEQLPASVSHYMWCENNFLMIQRANF